MSMEWEPARPKSPFGGGGKKKIPAPPGNKTLVFQLVRTRSHYGPANS
jgi:hypothetical protein